MTQLEDFLQTGSEQVAGGYVMYGSSTILAYTTGRGVNIFSELDAEHHALVRLGDFLNQIVKCGLRDSTILQAA